MRTFPSQAHRAFHGKRRHYRHRQNSTSPYLYRLCYLRSIRHLIRCAGGTWHGHSIAYDISVQIYCDNTATCVLPLQAHGTNRRMERILDNRSRHRFDICIYLQIFSFKAKRFKISTVAIPQLPFISV